MLGAGDVDVDADFFDLGGHSLLLVKLRSALRRATGAPVTIAELVAHTTPSALAGLLAGRGVA
ncbi:MAG: acyl carrier protein, partial [Gemmatimonadota bacterium]